LISIGLGAEAPLPETPGAWSGTMILPICRGISRHAKTKSYMCQKCQHKNLLSPDVFFKLKMH